MLPGCILEYGYNYEGNDILIETTKAPQYCALLCNSTVGGLFYTYKYENKECRVKNSKAGRRKEKRRIISGNRQCAYPLSILQGKILKLSHFTTE